MFGPKACDAGVNHFREQRLLLDAEFPGREVAAEHIELHDRTLWIVVGEIPKKWNGSSLAWGEPLRGIYDPTAGTLAHAIKKAVDETLKAEGTVVTEDHGTRRIKFLVAKTVPLKKSE